MNNLMEGSKSQSKALNLILTVTKANEGKNYAVRRPLQLTKQKIMVAWIWMIVGRRDR